MIRYTKHFNTDYLIIDSTLEIDNMIIPIQVQVNINSVKKDDHAKVYKIVNTAFNRNISFNKPKPQSKKSWFKFW